MKWFKHDSSASMDAKLKKLRIKYGMEGYGVYWYCLELVAGCVEKHNLTFELEHDSEIIANDTGIHHERINEIMLYMTKVGLFENDRGIITCLKMATRTDEYTQKLIKTLGNIPILSRQTPDSVGIKSELIEEKRREEKKNRRRFTPPSVEEVRKYINEKQYSIDPQEFVDHYEANGWYRGKTKIKDWKACVRTWRNNGKGHQQSAFNPPGAI